MPTAAPPRAAAAALVLALGLSMAAPLLLGDVIGVPGNPIIKALALTDDAGASRSGQQVDVNVGGTNPVYRLTTQIQEASGGWPLVEWVEFRCWYKNGNSAAGFNSTPGQNYNFYFNYTNTSDVTGSFSLRYPTTGEIAFVQGIDAAVNAQTHILTIRFRFGNQVHNASATGPWSWSYSVFVKDKNGRTDFATLDFGIFRFVSILVNGLPAGSANPGGTATLAPNITIAFSSNSAFFLEVTATDLTEVSGLPDTIGRQGIQINASTSTGSPGLVRWTYFTAADATLDVYGAYRDGAAPVAHAAYASGSSQTAIIRIKVDVPLTATPGTYRGTFTFRLWQQSVARPP